MDQRLVGFQGYLAKDPRWYREAENPKMYNSAQYSKFEACQAFGTKDEPDENRLAEVSLMFSASMMEDQRTQTAMNAIVPVGEA